MESFVEHSQLILASRVKIRYSIEFTFTKFSSQTHHSSPRLNPQLKIDQFSGALIELRFLCEPKLSPFLHFPPQYAKIPPRNFRDVMKCMGF
jgi:hypothetical protein